MMKTLQSRRSFELGDSSTFLLEILNGLLIIEPVADEFFSLIFLAVVDTFWGFYLKDSICAHKYRICNTNPHLGSL